MKVLRALLMVGLATALVAGCGLLLLDTLRSQRQAAHVP